MVGKAPGFVPCAHCAGDGAQIVCPACEHLVCTACAGRPGSCSITHAWQVECGDYNVEAIDGSGRYGLLARRQGAVMRALGAKTAVGIMDLVTRMWRVPPGHALNHGLVCGVTRTGHGLWQHGSLAGHDGEFAAVYTEPESPHETARSTLRALADDTGAWGLREDNVFVLARFGDTRLIRGVPQSFSIEAADFDAERGVLLVATWGAVHAFEVGDEMVRMDTCELGDRDVQALRLRGERALVVTDEPLVGLVACELAVTAGLERGAEHATDGPIAAAVACDISEGGRWIALAGRDALAVYDRDRTAVVELVGHQGRITMIRFTDGDQRLITADDQGRLIVRPRDGDGWCARVVSRGGEEG